ASPDVTVIEGEPGEEVFVFSRGLAVLKRHSTHLVTRTLVAVPGAVFGGEDVAVIFGGELLRFVKNHFEGSEVRLQKNVVSYYFVPQFGMFALMLRVVVPAHVIPGPAVEAAILNVGDVVRHKVIAQGIALID